MEEILRLMQGVTRVGQRRNKNKKDIFNLRWQFQAGRTTNAMMTDGPFNHPHNTRPGVGVWMGDVPTSSKLSYQKELYRTASELLQLVDPEFAGIHGDYVVNFACMDDPSHYVKWHEDSKDVSYQLAVNLGDFQGGELQVQSSDGSVRTFDVKHKVLKMDGRLPHQVLPFTGQRFTVISWGMIGQITQLSCWYPGPRFVCLRITTESHVMGRLHVICTFLVYSVRLHVTADSEIPCNL
jgi:hypothetical protein